MDRLHFLQRPASAVCLLLRQWTLPSAGCLPGLGAVPGLLLPVLLHGWGAVGTQRAWAGGAEGPVELCPPRG